MNNHLITLTVTLPLLGALFQAFLPTIAIRGVMPSNTLARWFALSASLASSICGFALVASMQTQTADLQSLENLQWVGSYAISYSMGIDGLNVLLALLVSVLFPLLIASEWNQKTGARGMYGLFLVLQTALSGAVFAQDLFLQFFFWGLSALPFYFLIGIWGGLGRETAAFRAIVAASIGNALLFAALILIYYSVDPHTFSIHELAAMKLGTKTFEIMGREVLIAPIAFFLIGAGLAFRSAIWPVHGWFAQVAREAPPSVFVAMAGVTIPVATYIFVRLCYTLFPETMAQASGVIVAVGAVNLVIGGVSALAQRDLRLTMAFVCLSEVGLILLGIGSLTSPGLVGAIYQQLSLGLGLGGFGLFIGVLSDRAGHSVFNEDGESRRLGGIATRAPMIAVVAGAFVASLLGFPGFSGFIGRALTVIGSYPAHPVAVIVAIGALLLATYYLFVMYRSIFLGSEGTQLERFTDLSFRERAYLLPLVACVLAFGIYPKPLLELVRPTILALLTAFSNPVK